MYVLGDIESDYLGEKAYSKKKDMESEYQSKNKCEQNHMREDDEMSRDLETEDCFSVLAFGVDHTKNLKVKDLRVLLQYNFGSEKLKGIP